MALKEKKINSSIVAQGSFFQLCRDTVELPDGKHSVREYIVHPGAVVIIPVLPDGKLILERQYRYPVQEVIIEFPAGKLDAHESALACAQRELLEETGYRATRWGYAGRIYPCIGYSNEIIEVWLATGLEAGVAQPDEGEFVEIFTATPEEVQEWALDGTLKDGKTLACLNWWAAWKAGSWQPQWHNI